MFLPKLYVETLHDIDIKRLQQKGIKALVCDIDNTLAKLSEPLPSEAITLWVKAVQEIGLRICLVSNNSRKRVETFAAKLDLPYVFYALKPLKYGYKKASNILGAAPSETCVIGDQIFTDIWGANRVGMYSVLINKLSKKEGFAARSKRFLEKIVMRGYKDDA